SRRRREAAMEISAMAKNATVTSSTTNNNRLCPKVIGEGEPRVARESKRRYIFYAARPGQAPGPQATPDARRLMRDPGARPPQAAHGCQPPQVPDTAVCSNRFDCQAPAPREPGARQARNYRLQATATGILPMRACHSLGPVVCTEVPCESTATVTGMSFTSNS